MQLLCIQDPEDRQADPGAGGLWGPSLALPPDAGLATGIPLLLTVGRSLVFSTALHTLGASTHIPSNWAHVATSIALGG